MATNTTPKQSKMQTELDAAAAGLTSITVTTLNSMMLLGVLMSKAEVITKLKLLSAVYAAATSAKQALSAAVNARQAGQQQTMAFYDALVMALKLGLGPSNEGMLASFGVALSKEGSEPTVEAKTIAKAKAAATREARGTKGKQQRHAITTQPSMSLQVLAVEKLRSALPGMKQFHGEAMHVARKHFGADAKTMSTFGVRSHERGMRRRRGCVKKRGGEAAKGCPGRVTKRRR